MSAFTANKFKEARTRAKYSQEEAAKRMNMSRRNLQYFEADERPVTSDQIVEFAKLYNVDVYVTITIFLYKYKIVAKRKKYNLTFMFHTV